MTNGFSVAPEIWARYSGMRLVCVTATGLDNQTKRPALDMDFETAQRSAALSLGETDLDTFPPFAAWRAVQPAKFTPAHEAIARRVLKTPLRSISPAVDCYNAMSLELTAQGIAAPIGGWCTTSVPHLRLGLTKGGERFYELGCADPVTVGPGETAYTDESGSEVITRHFVWRQAQLGATGPKTSSIILICELIAPFADQAEFVRSKMVETVTRQLSIDCRSTILKEPSTFWIGGIA